MTATEERIQTHDLATETVTRDGYTYKLDSHSPLETSGSLPALVYDMGEQTIWSQGGQKLDVEIATFEDDLCGLPSQIRIVDSHGMDAKWRFGGPDEADAHQRERLQVIRARALIQHTIS